jgi:hypothetical protein
MREDSNDALQLDEEVSGPNFQRYWDLGVRDKLHTHG